MKGIKRYKIPVISHKNTTFSTRDIVNNTVTTVYVTDGNYIWSEVKVAQSCPTFCNSMDCSPPGSSVHRILQTRILEWVVTKTAGSTYNSTGGLSSREQLERQAEFHYSTQDEVWLSCPNSAGCPWGGTLLYLDSPGRKDFWEVSSMGITLEIFP